MDDSSGEKVLIVLTVGVFVISFLVILNNGAKVYFQE